jgi:hypothetical protein
MVTCKNLENPHINRAHCLELVCRRGKSAGPAPSMHRLHMAELDADNTACALQGAGGGARHCTMEMPGA